MPAVLTMGGIALAVLGLLIVFAGMPDRAAGLGLGSDLIQAGATLLAGGLVVAALGQVLKALRDVSDRVEEAGLGVSAPRPALHDGLSETAPVSLPRAARNTAALQEDEVSESPPAPPARPLRTPREPQPAPRAARPAPETSRPLRAPLRPAPPAPQNPAPQEDFGEEAVADHAGERPAPRWMRAQAETPGVASSQSSRPARATPVTPSAPPRRETAPPLSTGAHDMEPRRRAAPVSHHEEVEHAEPTVVRSGIIAGMAYTLYSDRSIEAELPAGLVRFNSIEELQEHVRRAGVDEQEEYRGPNTAPH